MEEKSDAVGASSAAGRHRILGRLKKAAQFAAELRELAAARADGHTVLEAEAYASWMRAQFEIEIASYEIALASLVAARQIYEQLGRLAGRRQREVFEQRIEDIAPQERQCRYNLSRHKGASVAVAARAAVSAAESDTVLRPDQLAALADGRREGAASGTRLRTIFWRKTLLAVPSEQLRSALLAAEARSMQLAVQLALQSQSVEAVHEGADALTPAASGSGTEGLYLDALTKYDAAAKCATEEATRAAREGKAALSADCRAIEDYCQFLKLRLSLDRSVTVHAAQAEVLMAALQEGAAPPTADRTGSMSSSSDFVNQHPLLRALASASVDSTACPAALPWGAQASQCAAIYTRCIATIDEMATLCGSPASSSNSVSAAAAAADSLPVDESLLAALAARRALLLARRCWFLSLSLVAARRRSEAVALIQRTEERVANASKLFAELAAVEPLPPPPASQLEDGTSDGSVDGFAAGGHPLILAGICTLDLVALATLTSKITEQRIVLQAEVLLETTVAPRLRSDASVREAYSRFFGPEPQALTRSSGLSLTERLDPRRALSGAPITLEDALPASLSSSASAAPATASSLLGPLLTPLPVPLKPIVLDLAFGAGVFYPDLSPLLPPPTAPAHSSSSVAPAVRPTQGAGKATATTTAASSVSPAAAPAPAPGASGGLLGWLTGR